jgi:phosphatidate cytidylyltransferase
LSTPGNDPAANPNPNRRPNWADLGPRLASAFVLIPIVAITLYFGGYLFAVVVGGVFAGVYREWETMVTRAPLTPLGIVLIGLVGLTGPLFFWLGILGALGVIALAAIIAIVAHGEELIWRIGGLLLTGAIIVAVLALRGTELIGVWAGLYLATVVWMTDSAAFFTRRPRRSGARQLGRADRLADCHGLAVVDRPDPIGHHQRARPARRSGGKCGKAALPDQGQRRYYSGAWRPDGPAR